MGFVGNCVENSFYQVKKKKVESIFNYRTIDPCKCVRINGEIRDGRCVCALNYFIPFVHFLQLMDDIGCIIVQDS